MHMVPSQLQGRHPMMKQTNHISTRIIEYLVFVTNTLCMHEHMTQQQCICSHNLNNQHQHISLHAYTINSSPIARKKIHQQHICTYTYTIHQPHYNSTTHIISPFK